MNGLNLANSFGPAQRLHELLPVIYDQLREHASRALRYERDGISIQTTDLVHEAFLRLGRLDSIQWESEEALIRTALGVIRRVLVDLARKRSAIKRRAPGFRILMNDDEFAQPESVGSRGFDGHSCDLLALDQALEKLRGWDQRKAMIVDLRYFGGFSEQRIADSLQVSLSTVKREWNLVKAWLYRELSDELARG